MSSDIEIFLLFKEFLPPELCLHIISYVRFHRHQKKWRKVMAELEKTILPIEILPLYDQAGINFGTINMRFNIMILNMISHTKLM